MNRVSSAMHGFVQHQGKGSHFISHLWDKRRAARDGVHYPWRRQPLLRVKPGQRRSGFLSKPQKHVFYLFTYFSKKENFTVNATAARLVSAHLFSFFGFFLLLILSLLRLLGLIAALFLLWAAVTRLPDGPPGRPLWRLEVDPGVSRPVRIFTGRVAVNPRWEMLVEWWESWENAARSSMFTWSCFRSAIGFHPQRSRRNALPALLPENAEYILL